MNKEVEEMRKQEEKDRMQRTTQRIISAKLNETLDDIDTHQASTWINAWHTEKWTNTVQSYRLHTRFWLVEIWKKELELTLEMAKVLWKILF